MSKLSKKFHKSVRTDTSHLSPDHFNGMDRYAEAVVELLDVNIDNQYTVIMDEIFTHYRSDLNPVEAAERVLFKLRVIEKEFVEKPLLKRFAKL